MNLADKIRNMAEFVDVENISKSLGVPLELVQGILSGEVSDEVTDQYDPARPPEIRIVEQKKFVRSSVIGIVSLDSSGGSTLTSALATLTALKTDTPVVVADLNEYSSLGSYLGIALNKDKFYPNLMGFSLTEDLQKNLIIHPEIPNLSILLGTSTLKNFLTIPIEKMATVLEMLGKSHEVVWVDCPRTPYLWHEIFPKLDVICFLIKPNINSISTLCQIITILEPNIENHFVILKEDNKEILDIQECRKLIRDFTNMPILAQLPESNKIKKSTDLEQNYVLKYPDSDYARVIEKIVEKLVPGINRESKDQGSWLSRLFK